MTNQEYKTLVYLKRNGKSAELAVKIDQVEEKLNEIVDLYFDNNVLLRESKEVSNEVHEEFEHFKLYLKSLGDTLTSLSELVERLDEDSDDASQNQLNQDELIREMKEIYQGEREQFESCVDKYSQALCELTTQGINDKIHEECISLKNYLDGNLNNVEKILSELQAFKTDVGMNSEKPEKSNLYNYEKVLSELNTLKSDIEINSKKTEKFPKVVRPSTIEYCVVLLEETKKRISQYHNENQRKQHYTLIMQIAGFSVLFVLILFLYFV
jgi:uncharacterized phage infection (PIP) family protein YhgE